MCSRARCRWHPRHPAGRGVSSTGLGVFSGYGFADGITGMGAVLCPAGWRPGDGRVHRGGHLRHPQRSWAQCLVCGSVMSRRSRVWILGCTRSAATTCIDRRRGSQQRAVDPPLCAFSHGQTDPCTRPSGVTKPREDHDKCQKECQHADDRQCRDQRTQASIGSGCSMVALTLVAMAVPKSTRVQHQRQ